MLAELSYWFKAVFIEFCREFFYPIHEMGLNSCKIKLNQTFTNPENSKFQFQRRGALVTIFNQLTCCQPFHMITIIKNRNLFLN